MPWIKSGEYSECSKPRYNSHYLEGSHWLCSECGKIWEVENVEFFKDLDGNDVGKYNWWEKVEEITDEQA